MALLSVCLMTAKRKKITQNHKADGTGLLRMELTAEKIPVLHRSVCTVRVVADCPDNAFIFRFYVKGMNKIDIGSFGNTGKKSSVILKVQRIPADLRNLAAGLFLTLMPINPTNIYLRTSRVTLPPREPQDFASTTMSSSNLETL